MVIQSFYENKKNIKLNRFVVCKHNAKTHKMLIECSEKFYILTLICNLLRIKESFLLSWIDNFGRGVVESNEARRALWYILPRSDWNYHLKIFKEWFLFTYFFSILFPICTLKKNNIILKPLFVYEAHAMNYYAAQPILLSVFWFCY